jgi:hypothetical protein
LFEGFSADWIESASGSQNIGNREIANVAVAGKRIAHRSSANQAVF